MRTRTAFDPIPRPRQRATRDVTSVTVGTAPSSTVIALNPNTPSIPPLAYDASGGLLNSSAVLTALKESVESLAGQRGDLANRAVTFNDLVDYGILTKDALGSARGSTSLAVIPGYFTPADPLGSSAADPGVMMGIKAAFQAGNNGAFLIGMSGTCVSTGPLGTVAIIWARVGTVDPPAHGAVPSGVVIGVPVVLDVVSAGSRMSWAFTGVGLNYTPLATVWLDIALATNFGTATLGFINITTLGV